MKVRFKTNHTDDLVFSGFKWRLPLPIIAFYNLDLLSAREYAEQLTCIDAVRQFNFLIELKISSQFKKMKNIFFCFLSKKCAREILRFFQLHVSVISSLFQ